MFALLSCLCLEVVQTFIFVVIFVGHFLIFFTIRNMYDCHLKYVHAMLTLF